MLVIAYSQGAICNDDAVGGSEALFYPAREIYTLFNQNLRISAAFLGGLYHFKDVGGIASGNTLGKDTLLSWYAVILCEWMEGNGLNYIMRAALKHHREHPENFWINNYTRDVYNDNDKIHRNIVFADTLEVIENIVLFSISNYFLRFSNEFRRIKGDDELDANNWYEYVEYGTTNPLTILLQRNGFSRESARFIKENPEYVVKDGSTGKLKLKASLSKCGRTSVENEVEYIRQNIPGIFVDEED